MNSRSEFLLKICVINIGILAIPIISKKLEINVKKTIKKKFFFREISKKKLK
jgi:hypothetical protein